MAAHIWDRHQRYPHMSLMLVQGLRMVGYEVCNMSREERGRKDFWVACNDHILGTQLVVQSSRDMAQSSSPTQHSPSQTEQLTAFTALHASAFWSVAAWFVSVASECNH